MHRAVEAADGAALTQVEAYETMGCAYVALSDEVNARRVFRALLVIDPYWVLREPSGSPKIREVFERARREIVRDAALDPSLEVHLAAPERARAGSTVEVRVRVSGPVARVTLRSRRRGSVRFDRIAAIGAGRSYRA